MTLSNLRSLPGFAIVLALAACGPTPEAPTSERATAAAEITPIPQAGSADQEDIARTLARTTKKLEGACESDAACEALITDADLAKARGMSSQVFGTSAFGPKSARAPSTYLAKLNATPCAKSQDVCAVEWFKAYRAAMIRALNQGDDSDSPSPIPDEESETSKTMPYTSMQILQAGVSYDSLDNVFACRTAILTRRWLKDGGATQAEFNEAETSCLKPVVMTGG